MAKRKVRKANFIGVVLFAVMCVLAVLNFALPLLSWQGSASILGTTISNDKADFGLFGLLEGMSAKSTSDMSDAGRSAKALFFGNDVYTKRLPLGGGCQRS